MRNTETDAALQAIDRATEKLTDAHFLLYGAPQLDAVRDDLEALVVRLANARDVIQEAALPRVFLSVRGHRTPRELDAYLYGSSTVVDEFEGTAVVKVTGRTEQDAQRHAQTQADRYASGLIGARQFATHDDARADAAN